MSDFIINPYRFGSALTTLEAYEAAVLADAPVVFWPMQGDSVNAADDVIGTVNLTWTGTPSFQQAGRDTGWESVLFDGSTNYGESNRRAELPDLSDTTQSMELWFRRTSGTALASIAVLRDDPNQAESLFMAHNSPAAGNARGYAHGAFRTSGTGSYNDGNWHHRVDTWDGSTYRVYLDGALLQSGADTSTRTSSLQKVWVVNNEDTQLFGGHISHISVYDKTLSSTDVSDHYNAAF